VGLRDLETGSGVVRANVRPRRSRQGERRWSRAARHRGGSPFRATPLKQGIGVARIRGMKACTQVRFSVLFSFRLGSGHVGTFRYAAVGRGSLDQGRGECESGSVA